jgi:hypothetical protein
MPVTAPAPAPARRAGLWALRVTLTLHLLGALGQPVLAGLFLSGDVDAISWHGTIGSALAAVALAVVAAALAHVVLVRGQWWVLPVTVAQFLADGLQIGWGHARLLDLHVPLGVAVVTVSVLLAVWVWGPAAARRAGAAGSVP